MGAVQLSEFSRAAMGFGQQEDEPRREGRIRERT